MKSKMILLSVVVSILGSSLNSFAADSNTSMKEQVQCLDQLKQLNGNHEASNFSTKNKDASKQLNQEISREIEKLPHTLQTQIEYSKAHKLPMPFRSGYVMALRHCEKAKGADLQAKVATAKEAINKF